MAWDDIKHAAEDTDYIAKLNTHVDRTSANNDELTAARDGQGTLLAKINALDTANAAAAVTTAEVEAARDGQLTLLAKLQALGAAIGDVQTYLESASSFDQNNPVDVKALTLSAVNKALGVVAVDIALYDTTQDDDPQWVDNAAASWYSETLNTATRGATRPFPRQALLVLQANKLTIYDATDPDVPMWMVFTGGASNLLQWSTGTFSSLAAANGMVYVGHGTYDLMGIDFVRDAGYRWDATDRRLYGGSIVERNASAGSSVLVAGAGIVNRAVNGVVLTVGESTAVDPFRRMRHPTVCVVTDGGVSVIYSDGTEASNANAGSKIAVTGNRVAFTSGSYWVGYIADLLASVVRDNFYTDVTHALGVSNVRLLGDVLHPVEFAGDVLCVGSDEALNLIRENAASTDKGMIAYVTSDYNTGWMYGDIQAAVCASAVEGTLTDADTIADRSVKSLSITIPASETVSVSAVATGADLCWYQASADLTLTLGVDITSAGELLWWEDVSGSPVQYCYDYSASQGYVNGVAGTVSTNVVVSGTTLTIKSGAKLALVRAGNTATDANLLPVRYNDESPLFIASAKCTLPGSSNVVNALAYDADRDLLHVGTGGGSAVFAGLTNVSESAGAAVSSLTAQGGKAAIGTATDTTVSIPGQDIRAELLRQGREPVSGRYQQFDTTVGASDTDVYLPAGWELVAVWWGATDNKLQLVPKADYTRIADTTRAGVRFDAAPGAGTVGILAERTT